jgi:hypothetical protein
VQARVTSVVTAALLAAVGAMVGCRGEAAVAEARADEGPGAVADGVAVVELFTSEGCSSCPAADEVLEGLVEKGDGRVYPLAFHVDYWDELGWPDRFASHANTERQRAYGEALGARGLYTPQVIVGGREEFVGSDRGHLQAAVARSLREPAKVGLAIHARAAGAGSASVDYDVSEVPQGAVLNVVVAQSHATSEVGAGENAGKTLRHANVVVGLTRIVLRERKGNAVVRFPASLADNQVEVIAFAQRPSGGSGMPVLGAARAPLSPPQ